MKVFILSCFVFCGCHSLNNPSLSKTVESDETWIREAIGQMEASFNAGRHRDVLRYYAKDLLVSYPNTPDKGYADFEKAYAEMDKPSPGLTVSTKAKIDEITVSGDYAYIRMDWNTKLKWDTAAQPMLRVARDFQVWQRQSEGGFKFFRGMWFRNPPIPVN